MNASDRVPPIIGVTTYLEQSRTGVWDVPAAFLPKVYFDAVTRAGGIAVLLPPQPATAEIAARVVDSVDGLIISGGKDVDPARYGQQPHPTTDAPRRDRDDWEHAILAAALEADLPVFGICRGLQLLNVVRGGTLIQHLPDVVGSTRYNLGGGVFNSNDVSVEPASRLGAIIGSRITVKSYHHQAVDVVGDGLTVSAMSDDGIVQGLEVDGVTFGIAVQWHPEEDGVDLRLFRALVDAASARLEGRRRGSANLVEAQS